MRNVLQTLIIIFLALFGHSAVFRYVTSVQFSRSVMFDSTTPWTAVCQASCTSPTPRVLKLISIESAMPSNHLVPFSCPQSLPASGSFQMSQIFASGSQIIWVSGSTSVLPMNIQDSFLLGWAGWIFLQSNELSRVFPNTIVQTHQFLGTELSL